MAKRPDDLSDVMGALSMNSSPLKKPDLDDDTEKKLKRLENDYESIFSWDIERLTGINQSLMFNIMEKIKERCELLIDDNLFNHERFFYKLIATYEHYIHGRYEESLLEIKSIVNSLESCIYDESNRQFKDAYNHIARASYAYLEATLKHNYEQVLHGIKSIYKFSQADKAAIYGVKAKVFMEYPPLGNAIALKFAERTRNLQPGEPEYTTIWLKAKGRVRHYNDKLKLPEKDEIVAAEWLSRTNKPWLLIQASKLYFNLGYLHTRHRNFKESDKYYKLSSDLVFEAAKVSKEDKTQLYKCFLSLIEHPPKFIKSRRELCDMISQFENISNRRLDQALGKYYKKHLEDYEMAKLYFSRGMAAGLFTSSMELVKVELLLQPLHSYPFVQSLRTIYDLNLNPKRRIIVLSQILMYYCYSENNPKEIMEYLKLFMDLETDDLSKKQMLTNTNPFFYIPGFKANIFIYYLSDKVDYVMKFEKWSTSEKEIVNETFNRFNKMLKVRC